MFAYSQTGRMFALLSTVFNYKILTEPVGGFTRVQY